MARGFGAWGLALGISMSLVACSSGTTAEQPAKESTAASQQESVKAEWQHPKGSWLIWVKDEFSSEPGEIYDFVPETGTVTFLVQDYVGPLGVSADYRYAVNGPTDGTSVAIMDFSEPSLPGAVIDFSTIPGFKPDTSVRNVAFTPASAHTLLVSITNPIADDSSAYTVETWGFDVENLGAEPKLQGTTINDILADGHLDIGYGGQFDPTVNTLTGEFTYAAYPFNEDDVVYPWITDMNRNEHIYVFQDPSGSQWQFVGDSLSEYGPGTVFAKQKTASAADFQSLGKLATFPETTELSYPKVEAARPPQIAFGE